MRKWLQAGLEVRVNAELGLTIEGVDYIIKLYFKDEPLTKARLAVVFELMKEALRPRSSTAMLAVLDVGNAKLIEARQSEGLGPLSIGEATSFVAMWNAI